MCRVPYLSRCREEPAEGTASLSITKNGTVPRLQGNIPQEARQCGGTWDSTESDFDAPILGESGCGLWRSMIWVRRGITHLKIVGRGNHPVPDGGRHPGDEACVGDPGCLQDRETYQKRMKQGVVFERLQQKLLIIYQQIYKILAKTLAFWKKYCIVIKRQLGDTKRMASWSSG